MKLRTIGYILIGGGVVIFVAGAAIGTIPVIGAITDLIGFPVSFLGGVAILVGIAIEIYASLRGEKK